MEANQAEGNSTQAEKKTEVVTEKVEETKNVTSDKQPQEDDKKTVAEPQQPEPQPSEKTE